MLGAVAVAIVAGLVLWLRRAETRLVAISLGAIAGGAAGNVLDRLRFGAVVDFIHLHAGGWSWYVFNVADAAIVCGVAALVLDGMLPRGRRNTASTQIHYGVVQSQTVHPETLQRQVYTSLRHHFLSKFIRALVTKVKGCICRQ